MGPQNIIMDDSSTNDLPEKPLQEELLEEKKMAKYTKTAEFKRIQDHFAERIKFYQAYLPDGRPVAVERPTPEQWMVANALIAEFNQVINMYETAAEAVTEAAKEENGV